MIFTRTQISALLALAATAMAHGIITTVSSDSDQERGYNPEFQWTDPSAVVAGWGTPENIELGFINTPNFGSSDMICHMGATNAKGTIKVSAGASVTVQWTPWPDSHKGPVIDYLASCNGACSEVDKESLKFFKIDEKGLIDGSVAPGRWASDELIENGNKWEVAIPKDIPSGEYVLRHEIIALHAAHEPDRTEAYPQCISITVENGDDSKAVPEGISATELYDESQPGIGFGIHRVIDSYEIPGPKLYTAAAGNGNNNNNDNEEDEGETEPTEPTEPAEPAEPEFPPENEEENNEEEYSNNPNPIQFPKPEEKEETEEVANPPNNNSEKEESCSAGGSAEDDADLQELLAWWRRRRSSKGNVKVRRHMRDFFLA